MKNDLLPRVYVPGGLHQGLEEHGVIVSLKPGDKLVLMCRDKLSIETKKELAELARRYFSTDQIVIMDSGMRLAVLRSESGAA